MEGGKKIIAAVVLIVVIVGAVVFVLKKNNMIGGPQPPAWVLDQEQERIDMDNYDVAKLKLRDWNRLGPDSKGRYKNPKTGKYTMVGAMECAACKKKIPVPDMPQGTKDQPPTPEEMDAAHKAAVCPLCKKNPYPEEQPDFKK